LFVLLVAGLVGLRQLGRLAWMLTVTALFVVLLVMAASYEGPWVALLTGAWWNDRFRFEGLSMLGIAVVCSHGVLVIADRSAVLARRWAARGAALRARRSDAAAAPRAPRRSGDRPLRGWLAAAVVLAVFALVTRGFYADYNRSRMQLQYALGTGGSVTAAELTAFDALSRLVEPGETVMNDPSDGTAWVWALKGVRPMFGQAVLTPIRPPLERDQQIALDDFHCIDSSQAVRDVVEKYDVRHVILGTGFIIPTMERAEGLRSLSESRSLHLVYDEDDVQIYEVDLRPLVPVGEDAACRSGGEQEHGSA
jgi:hypothetical protein